MRCLPRRSEPGLQDLLELRRRHASSISTMQPSRASQPVRDPIAATPGACRLQALGQRAVRAQSSLRVISILCHFLWLHRTCIAESAGDDWSAITGVPSSTDRGADQHPLIRALQRVPSAYDEYEDLLERGPTSIGHNRASDTGYVVRHPERDLTGKRVLLIDDTFTSGARSQSAASALALAGAEVVAIVVIGRVIDPRWSGEEYWAERRAQDFSFDTCCVHHGAR